MRRSPLPDDKIRCVDADGQSVLSYGNVYVVLTVVDIGDGDMVELVEHPRMLFTPGRFERLTPTLQ